MIQKTESRCLGQDGSNPFSSSKKRKEQGSKRKDSEDKIKYKKGKKYCQTKRDEKGTKEEDSKSHKDKRVEPEDKNGRKEAIKTNREHD